MVDARAMRQKELREKLAQLRNAAFAELEGRGYEVRGKTPIQIRQILKRRPSKQNPSARNNDKDTTVSSGPTSSLKQATK